MVQSFTHVFLQKRFTVGIAEGFPRDQLSSENTLEGVDNDWCECPSLGDQQPGLQLVLI